MVKLKLIHIQQDQVILNIKLDLLLIFVQLVIKLYS